jgi:hypothetical protein
MKPINHPLINDYYITRTGAVVSSQGNVMQPRLHATGYIIVSVNQRLYFVHKLVAATYLQLPKALQNDGGNSNSSSGSNSNSSSGSKLNSSNGSKLKVLHFDGNKLNNLVDNLFYADDTSFDKLKIRYLHKCGNSVERIAKVFNLSKVRVYQIVKPLSFEGNNNETEGNNDASEDNEDNE